MTTETFVALLGFASDCDRCGSPPNTGIEPTAQAALLAEGLIEQTPHGWDTTAAGDVLVSHHRAATMARLRAVALAHVPVKRQAEADAMVAEIVAKLQRGEHLDRYIATSNVIALVPPSRARKARANITSWVMHACPWPVLNEVIRVRNLDREPSPFEVADYANASRLNLAAAERRARKAALAGTT